MNGIEKITARITAEANEAAAAVIAEGIIVSSVFLRRRIHET